MRVSWEIHIKNEEDDDDDDGDNNVDADDDDNNDINNNDNNNNDEDDYNDDDVDAQNECLSEVLSGHSKLEKFFEFLTLVSFSKTV